MPPRNVPSYRQRAGYGQAIVTLTDALTKQRRDYWLGKFNSPESRELYFRLLAEWESRGRRLPPQPGGAHPGAEGETLSELMHAYWCWAQKYYNSSRAHCIKAGLRILRKLYGHIPATDFSPNKLRVVRDEMVRGDPAADPPRIPWSRPYVNHQVRYIRHMFKWAAAREMVPVTVYEQLRTVEPLKRGRTEAREPEPVGPVSDHLVDPIEPFVSRQVWALIQLQRFTGARSGELFKLRPVDFRRDEKTGIWTVAPAHHKTAHRGRSRTIYFGPQAQEVIKPFLINRRLDAYLFSPAEAEAERMAARSANRVTPLSCGNKPGSRRSRRRPERPPGDYYTNDSYRRAIQRACDQAFPPPPRLARQKVPAGGRKANSLRLETDAEWRARLGPAGAAELAAWQKVHRWHPHQLRHAAATRIRREFGLEAAQLALGHSSALVTDAVYAERDAAKVAEIMKRIG